MPIKQQVDNCFSCNTEGLQNGHQPLLSHQVLCKISRNRGLHDRNSWSFNVNAVAETQTSNDGIPHIADSAETFNQHSDEYLLYFLLAGQGPIADENQELLKSMNFDLNKPHTDEEALDLLINEDVTYSDSFPEIK